MPEDRLQYLGARIHDARKACDLTQQELADETGVSIKMIQCIEKKNTFFAIAWLSTVRDITPYRSPPYPGGLIAAPQENPVFPATSNLFNVEPDQQEEEINRFLGKFRACNRSNQLLLLETLDFLAEQLLARQDKEESGLPVLTFTLPNNTY